MAAHPQLYRRTQEERPKSVLPPCCHRRDGCVAALPARGAGRPLRRARFGRVSGRPRDVLLRGEEVLRPDLPAAEIPRLRRGPPLLRRRLRRRLPRDRRRASRPRPLSGAGAGASAAAQVPPPVSRARNAYGLRISVRAPASARPPPKSPRETAAESATPPPAPRRTAATSSTPTAGSAARTTATTARPRDARPPRRRDARRARDAAPPAGCRAFTSDCGTCDTYCSRLDDA